MEPPAFPSGLQTVRAAPGGDAALVLPLPAGTPPFHYQWSRAGASLDDRFAASEDAGGVRLTVSAARVGDSGVYTLQASNAAGSDTTRVRLEVSPDEAPTGDDPPTFLRRLQDLTVKVGTRTRFLVEIISSTECKVTWYRNERRLMEAERVALARDGNLWCADLASVSVDDAGRWTCTAENDGGRASCSAYLNVLVPKAYKRPEFVEELRALLTEQGTVSLECKVVGVPTPVLRWFKDSREIKAGDVFALTANAEDPTSLGTYTCEAVNCMGRAYSSSKVHVVGRGSREGSARPSSSGVTPEPPPIFTKELEDQFVRISEHLSLSCHIMVPPWPRAVVWYNKEGKVEPNERYHVVEDGVGGYLLEVLAAEWCDEGEWKCVATSQGGRVGISTCYVAMDVPKNYRKPRFMENLQAVLTEEGLVSFECKVVGFPTPVLSWFKDGQELKPGDVYQLTGTNSLGSYCCIARNCMGQASSSAELTVEDIQNQLNEEEKLQLFSKNQAPKFIQGLKSVEAKIDEPFRFTIKVAIPPEPSLLWYRDEQPVDESTRCHLGNEEKGEYFLDIQNLEFIDQAEWKCVAKNDFGHSVTSCFLKLIIPRHYKKPRFLENLQAILSDEGAVNLECKVIGVPQPILKWYKDGEELKPGDIHRIISGQDGTCCLGTYTCEAQNCMGIAASSASLLGFDDSMKAKSKKKAEEQALQRNLSLSTIHEERTSQMYDTPVGDITLDDKGEISFSFDGKEVSVSLYETPDLTEEEALQIVEMYADQLSENVTEHNVIELPPLRFVKETSTSGNLLMEAIIIDVSPEYFASPEEDLRTEADIEDISIADENAVPQLSLDQDVGGEDYLEKTMALLSEEKSDVPKKIPRKKSDSPRSGDDYFSLSRDHSLSEDKKDDDTQMLTESDLQSFASARSSGKPKSKSSKPSAEDGQESSDVTKTILFKDEAKKHAAEPIEPPVVKPKRERRSSRGSRRSSSGSEKSVNKPKEDLPLIQTEVVQPSIMPLMSDKEFKAKMSNVSISLSKIINDVQIIEKDIILKSELMSSAATASRSLEIISSLITPLSEIHSIADAAAESGNESKEVSSSLFNKLPQSLKTLQQSLTIIEKCIDVESDSKTLVKKTCVAFIEKCGGEINQLLSDIGLVTKQNYLLTEKKTLANIESLVNDMTNVIKFSADTIKAKNLISEASEIKVDEPSIESKHIKDTQKAVFELKSPLNSLLCIAESAETDQLVDITKVKSSEVILVNMSASIQDLQTALEQIESLSVKEASTSLNKYNTEIIEIVMQPILKLRNSFEQLSTESKNDEDKNVLKQALNAIKQNLNELSSQIKLIETNVGTYDVLQSDNKLEILQKMAQILIALENNLPRLELIPEIKLHMATFHKNLTKVLENVIESNDAKRYFTLLEICGAVNRVNNAIKNIDSDSVLSLASLCSTLRIIQDQFVNNIFESELNCSILTNITDVLLGIQEAINHADEISVQQESEHIQELSAVLYDANKAKVIVEHLDHVIAAISTVKSIESAKDLQLALTPAFESICPVLEDLKRNVASIRPTEIHEEEHISELSDVSIAQSIATPLCELNQNIMILNETIVENIASLKENSEIMATIAAPLYELHSTLQILQQDVISQYDENLTPYDVSINMVSAVQNLQSCIVMIQEHAGIDAIDEMSTLEDISCIKTTADPIPSDRLVLPSGEETAVHQSLLPLRQELTTTATAEALQTLNEHITVLQNPEIIDALDTLSEVSDYSSLKSFALGLDELHAGIDQILHPILIEHSNEILNFSDTSKLAAVAEPMQELQQCLSVLSTSNIPIYEHILELPTEKIHSVFKNISDFKEHLTKCMLAIFPAMETADKTIEISNKVEALRDVCEHLRDIITTTKLVSTALPVNQEVSDLEHLINNLLDATDVTKGIKIDQVKGITEDLFNKVLTVQEELIQFTPHTPENLAQEAKLIQAINEIESNIAVLEQYDFVDLSRASDITSCTSPQLALELEAESLLQIDDMVENAVNIIQDSTEETSLRDLLVLENFFKICKDKFTILRCLITKQLSHKKIIRLVQEFKSLQSVIDEFKTKKSDLRLSIEINDHLFGFLSHADESLEGIHNSLIKILSSQSELLFKIPAAKLETANEVLKQTLSNQKAGNNEELIEKFIHVIELIKPIIQKAETDIIGEIQTRSVHSLTDENIVTKRLQELFLLVENQASVQSLDNETREVLNNILNCAQKHKEYEVATGTGKTLIIIKCLSECVDILQASFSESNLPETEMTKTKQEDSTLKIIVSEMMEPLQALHTHIVNVQEQILSGADEESISFDITSTESLVQTVSDIHKEIVKQIEDIEMSTVDSKDRSIIIEVDKELLMIQESMKSIENVQGAEVIKELSKPIEDIENSLHALLTSEKVITEEKDLILKDVNSNIDSLENAIERFINIEIKLLATFGLICEVDLNKSIQLATELKTLLSLTPQELQNSSLIQMKNEKVSLLKTILSKFDWLDTEIHLRGRNSLETEKLKQIFLTTYQLLTELNKVESVSYFDDIPLTSRVHHDNEKDAMIPLMHHIDQYIELIEIVEEISAVIKIEELKESVNVARELRESIAAVEDGAQSEFSMEMRNEINSKQADLVHQLQRALSAVQVHVFDCVQELSPEIGKDVLERLAKVTSQLQNDLTAVTGVQVAVQAPYIPSDEITKSINISEKLSEMVETIPSEVANVAQTTQPTILEQMNILNKESTIVVQIDAITEDEVKEAVKSKEVFVVEESEVLEKEFQADKAEATNIKQAIAAEVLEQIVIDNVSTIAEEKCLTEKLSSSSVDTVITSDVLVLDKIDTSDNNISVERVSVSQEVLPTTVKQLSDWNMDGTKSDKALEVIEDIHPKASIDQLMLHIEQFISQSTVANELSALIKIEDFEKSLQIAKELQQNIYELTADMQIKDGHMTSHDIQAQQESLSQKLHTSLTAIQQQALENVNKLSPIIDTNVLCNLIEVTGNLDKDIVAIITKIDVQLATNLINDNITQLKEVISEYIPTESTLQIADEQTVVVKEECIDFQKATSTSTESHIAELEITKVVSEEAPLIKDFKDETVTLSMSEQKNTIAEELQEQQTISTAEVKVLSEVVALADNVAVDEVKQSTNEDLLVSKAGEIEIKIVTDEKIVPSEDTEFQQITSTIELQKITGEAAEDREVLSKTIESLIHNIQDYISEDISQIVNNICSIVNLNDLKQSVSLAKDLCQNISQISVSTEMEQKVIPIDVLTKQAITAQQLLKALSTLQIQILENVKELVPFIGNNDITKATNAIERLNIDLEAVVSSYQILLQPSLKTVEELSLKTHLTECEIQTLETISDIVTHSNETEQIHKPNVETQATVPFGMMDNVVFEQINIMNEPEIPRDVAVTHSNEALCVATTTLIVPMNTTAPQSSNETTALESLLKNVGEFITSDIIQVVNELSTLTNTHTLKQLQNLAIALRDTLLIPELELDKKSITLGDKELYSENCYVLHQLHNALSTLQVSLVENTEKILTLFSKDIVDRAIKVTSDLYTDLETVISSIHTPGQETYLQQNIDNVTEKLNEPVTPCIKQQAITAETCGSTHSGNTDDILSRTHAVKQHEFVLGKEETQLLNKNQIESTEPTTILKDLLLHKSDNIQKQLTDISHSTTDNTLKEIKTEDDNEIVVELQQISLEPSDLITNIDTFVSDEVLKVVEELAEHMNIIALKESVAVAKELRERIEEEIDFSLITENKCQEQAQLKQKLLEALTVFQEQTLVNAQEIKDIVNLQDLQRVTDIVIHLQENLRAITQIPQKVESIPDQQMEEIVEVNSMKQLQDLLQEVSNKIDLATPDKSTEDTETLRDTLDEVQTVIIKLKRDFDGTTNDTLNETLEDLECSVRSVQLQINEDSPPQLLKEACATLQLLVTSMKETQEVQLPETTIKEMTEQIILDKCSNETGETVKLLEIAANVDTKHNSSLMDIINNLSSLKDIMKTLRVNFLGNAETLVENGIDVIHNLDQIEDKIFSLERNVEIEKTLSSSDRDIIITAIHSVYGSISNMRGTISSIQKQYMCENFGKPAENILRSIKMVSSILKQGDEESKNKWKRLSKSFRNILNHFEDIKFYINLDKTARLPSDAAFTKIILEELKSNIEGILLTVTEPVVIEKLREALKCAESNLLNIETRTTLEVKEKIPIFKELSSRILNLSLTANTIKLDVNEKSSMIQLHEESEKDTYKYQVTTIITENLATESMSANIEETTPEISINPEDVAKPVSIAIEKNSTQEKAIILEEIINTPMEYVAPSTSHKIEDGRDVGETVVEKKYILHTFEKLSDIKIDELSNEKLTSQVSGSHEAKSQDIIENKESEIIHKSDSISEDNFEKNTISNNNDTTLIQPSTSQETYKEIKDIDVIKNQIMDEESHIEEAHHKKEAETNENTVMVKQEMKPKENKEQTQDKEESLNNEKQLGIKQEEEVLLKLEKIQPDNYQNKNIDPNHKSLEEESQLEKIADMKEAKNKEDADRERKEGEIKYQQDLEENMCLFKETEQANTTEKQKLKQENEAIAQNEKEDTEKIKTEIEKKEAKDDENQKEKDKEVDKLEEHICLENNRLEEKQQIVEVRLKKEEEHIETAAREKQEEEIKRQEELRLEEEVRLVTENKEGVKSDEVERKHEEKSADKKDNKEERVISEKEKKEDDVIKQKADDQLVNEREEADRLEKRKIDLEKTHLKDAQQLKEAHLENKAETIQNADKLQVQELQVKNEVIPAKQKEQDDKLNKDKHEQEKKEEDKLEKKEDKAKQEEVDRLRKDREKAEKLEEETIDLEKNRLEEARQLDDARLKKEAEDKENADREEQEKKRQKELRLEEEARLVKEKEQDDKLEKKERKREIEADDGKQNDEANRLKAEKEVAESKVKQEEEEDWLTKQRHEAEKLEKVNIESKEKRLEETCQLDEARLKKQVEHKEKADKEQEKKRQENLRLEEEAHIVIEKEQDDKLESKKRKDEKEAADRKQKEETDKVKSEKEKKETEEKAEQEKEDQLRKEKREAEKLEKEKIELEKIRLEETRQLDEALLKKEAEDREKAVKEQQEQEKRLQEELRLEEEERLVKEKEQDNKLEKKKQKREKEAADRKQMEEADRVKSEKEKKEAEDKVKQEEEDRLRKESEDAEKLEKEKIESEKKRLEEVRLLDEAHLKKEAEDKEKAAREQQEQEKKRQEELRLEEEARLVKEKEQDDKLEEKKQKREKETADKKQKEETDRLKSENEKKEAEDKSKQEKEDRLRKEKEEAEKLEKEEIELEKKRLEEARQLDEARLKKEAEDKDKADREQQEQEKKRQDELQLEEETRLLKEKEQNDKLEKKKRKREKEAADKKQKEETDRLKSEKEKKDAEDKAKQEEEDRLKQEKEAEKLEKEKLELDKKCLEEARQLDEARLKKEAEDKEKTDREQQEQEKKRQEELRLEEEARLVKEKEQDDKLEEKKRKREKEAADRKQKEEADRLKIENEKKETEDKAKQEEEDRLKKEKEEAEKLEKEKIELEKKRSEEVRQLDEAHFKKEAEDKDKADREQQEQEKKRQDELRLEEETRLLKEKEQNDKLEKKKRKREKEAADKKQKDEADRLKSEKEKKEAEDKAKQEEEDRLKKEKEAAEKLEKEKIELEKKRLEEAHQLDEARLKKEGENKEKADREQQEQQIKRQEEENRLKKKKEAAEKLEKENNKLEKKRLEKARQLDEARLKKEAEDKEKADREQQEQEMKRQEEEDRLKKEKEAAEKLEKEKIELEIKRLEEARQLDEARLKKEAEDKEKADREQQEQEMKRQEEEDRLKKEKEAAEKLEKAKIELEKKRLEEARQLDEARLKKEAEDKEKADREQQEQEKKRQDELQLEEETRLLKEKEQNDKLEKKKRKREKEAADKKQKEETDRLKSEKEKKDAEDKAKQEEEDRLKQEKEAEKLEKEKLELDKKCLEEARQLDEARLKKEAEDKEKADREQQEQEKKRQEELRLEEEARLVKEKEQDDKLKEKKRKREKEAADRKQKEEADRLKIENEKKETEDKAKQEEEDRLKKEKIEAEKLENEKIELEKKRLEVTRQLDEARLKKEAEDKEKADREQQEQEKKRQDELRLEEETRLLKEKEQNDKLEKKKRKREKEAADKKQKEETDRLKSKKEKKEAEDKAKQEEVKRLKKEKEKAEILETEKIESEKKRLEEVRQLKEAGLNKEAEENTDKEQQEKIRQEELCLKEENRLTKEKEKQEDERKHQEQLRHEEEAHRTKEKEQVTDNLQKKKRKQDNKEDKKLKIKEQTDKLDNEKIELEKKVPDRSTRNNDTQFKYDEEAKLQKDDKDTRKVIKNYENERNILNENESNNIHEKLQINDNKKIIKNKETNIEVKGIEKMEQPTEITVGPIKKLDGEELEYNLESSQENQNYIKEYNYEPVTGRRKQDDKEKSSKIIHQNRRDYTMEFARPPGYREKTYEIDRYSLDSHSRSRSPGIFKAETLILDAQIRSSLPPYSEKDRNSETIERREIKHKPKAVSEARSILSEKRSSMPRDIKRKPVFSTHLTDRTAVEGSRVKLMCSVLSLSDPVITWYRNGVIIDNKLKYRTKFVDGLITLEVLNAIPSDSAEYNCTVENENGSVSTSANLKVYPSFKASPIPPTFTRSIRDTYHLAENELVLECRIRGQPLPAITWLKDDKPIVTNDRFQAYYLADGVCRLAIDSPTPDDSGKYTCKAENSVWSDQISHVVNFTGRECQLSPNLATIERSRFNRQAMESRRPHFTNVLSDFKVARGGTIGLQVEIRGSPTRVEWLREGYSVIDTYKNAQSFVEQGLYTLALSDVTEKESGLYTCRAWSNHGTVDMNAAITVVQPNELEGKPAIIVGRPEKDVLISVGEDLNISFRVQGEPKPKVIFMKGIRDITNSQRVCKMTSDDYVKFTLKRSVIADAGTYCILARNAYGCDRAFVTVVIRQRASSENLISDWTYPLDDSAISMAERNYKSVPDRIPGEPSVVDGGNNWVTLAWSKPDPRVTAPVLAYKVESWLAGKEGGARWTELGITPLNSFDAFNLKQGEEYHFRVTPRNRYGWGESVQTSTPIGVGLAGDRPEFVEILPGQLKVLLGSSANLSCSVKGKPIPEVVWMKNGHEIDEEERRMKTTFNGYNCSLTINDIHIEDEARYSCEATNVHGRASTYARLAVVTDKSIWEADAKLKRERSADVEGVYPPQFTMRLRDRRVQATYPVRLTCQVVGSPAPSVTWYRDGEEVTLDSRHTQSQDEHFHTLEIAPTTLEDGGLYEALARNPSGAVSCRCSLVVDKGIRAYVAPEFCCGLEPLYRLSEGEELRISAVVEAYPSVGVTWYRDGIRLRPSRRAVMTLDRDGQIELALAAITPREAGVYTCTASNEVGRASTSGKVEVIGDGPAKKKTPPMLISPDVPYSKEPMFIRKPRSSEAREGDTVIIQCEVVGDPKPDVYWLRDFLKPDYYRDATHFKRVGAGPEYRFEIPHAKLDYTGAYSVVARNVHGEAKAVISLQILAKDPSAADDVHNVRYGRVEVIPRFERDLTDLLCYDGDAIEFECRVSGNPEPDIRWFHYTELIRECPDFEWSCDDGTARLKIKQVTAEDEGTYICEAANNLGKATSSACLVVYPPGEPNTLSQRLRRPPALLSAASTPRSTPRSTPARSVSRTPGPDPRRLCSSPSRQMAPKFYTYPFNKVVEEGDHVVFQCAVKGLPAPWATWDKDGVIITPSSRITIREKDEILRILEIEQVTIEDVGLYRITLENDFGRAEASARLEVITQKGKFYAGVRSCSASPRKSFSYRRRAPSSSKD